MKRKDKTDNIETFPLPEENRDIREPLKDSVQTEERTARRQAIRSIIPPSPESAT